jgi:MoaA/NifB/PqqE/SkfB family radical SAM enzyme
MSKCILPWISIETTPTGKVRPCCLYTEELADIDLNTHTLQDAFESKPMRDLRRSFRRGEKPSGCERCWMEEDAGKKSKREYMLEKFKHEDVDYSTNSGSKLKFLDLKLGNICNLKCRICGTWSSSKWGAEEIDYYEPNGGGQLQRQWMKQGQWPRKNKTFWEHMDDLLPDIKFFEFTGGEPWMIKQHFDLLQRAVDKGYAKDIDIHYNTNTTQYPKDPSIWKHFKHIQIAFSVDNTEKRFEYERYGAKWRTSNNNIKKVHALRDKGYPISTQLCATWNIQNVYYMEEVLDWAAGMNFNDIHFNLMHDPWEYALSHTPKSAQAKLMLYLQKCQVKYAQYSQDIDAIKKIVVGSQQQDAEELHKKIRRTDLYRNENFALSHTKIAKEIGYEL